MVATVKQQCPMVFHTFVDTHRKLVTLSSGLVSSTNNRLCVFDDIFFKEADQNCLRSLPRHCKLVERRVAKATDVGALNSANIASQIATYLFLDPCRSMSLSLLHLPPDEHSLAVEDLFTDNAKSTAQRTLTHDI